MQKSEKVMDSANQMPQVTPSASQPPQVKCNMGGPQQMQHGRTTQGRKRIQNTIIPHHEQGKSSATSPRSEGLPEMPQQAPDMQSLRPMHGAQQTRDVMCELQENPQVIYKLQQKPQMSAQQKEQVNIEKQQMQQAKTMDHQRQQAGNVSKKTHISHERPRNPRMMPPPWKILGKTPVTQQVSGNNQTKLSVNNTFQNMELKTQSRKEQQEMVLLLQGDGSVPSKLKTVLTSLPIPETAIHVFIAQEQPLQSTPAAQKVPDELTASQTSVPKHSLKDYVDLMQELDFSLILEFLSLTPMIESNPPPTGSFEDIAPRSGSEQDITGGIQDQFVHDKNMHKPSSETIQNNQEQPSPILSDSYKNLMAALLTDEDAEHYYDSDCKTTPPLPKDIQETLQDIEQCGLETTDSDTTTTCKIKESTYMRKMRHAHKVSGIKKHNQINPSTGSYCRLRHDLLQIRGEKSSRKQTESSRNKSAAKIVFCFKNEYGETVHVGPSAISMSPQRFLERISVRNVSEKATSKTDNLKIFCGLDSSSREPIMHAKISEVKIMVTPVLDILRHLSQQATPNAIKGHVYAFSALLQKLHLRNQAASEYFKDIVSEHLRNSEVLTAHQFVGVTNSQTQTGVGSETFRGQDESPLTAVSTDETPGFRKEVSSPRLGNKQSQEKEQSNSELLKEKKRCHPTRAPSSVLEQSNSELLKEKKRSHPTRAPRSVLEAVSRFCAASPSNGPGFIERLHLKFLLKSVADVLNISGSPNRKNNGDNSIQTVSQTNENKKIGKCCIINWNQKFKRSNKAKDQLKNLKHCCSTCKTQSSVTSGSESNNNVIPSPVFNSRSVPGTMPKKNEQEAMKQAMRLAKIQEWRELCEIFRAGEDAIMACVGNDSSSKKEQNPKMSQTSKRSEAASTQNSVFKPIPGELYLLMPANEQTCLVWNLLIDTVDGEKVDAKFYEAGKGGFIEYMETSEALRVSRSKSATEYSKPHSKKRHQQSASARIGNKAVPSCKCNTCTDSDRGPIPAISSGVVVVHSFEVLMEALVLGATLDHATEVLQDTQPDDTRRNKTKKGPHGKQQKRRY